MRPTPVLALVLLLHGSPAGAAPTGEWVARMDGLAAVLTSLLTVASDKNLDEAGRARLRSDVAALRQLAHGVTAMSAKPDSDPTVPLLLRELEDAIAVVDGARADRIEDTVLAVAWTCMGCHTRAAMGTPRPLTSLAPVDKSLPADVRGTVLAATRRFSEARAAFRAGVFDEAFARDEPTRWERSVSGALLLDLRLNHDARGALEITERVLDTPNGERLWVEASAWRKVLVPMAKSTKPHPKTLRGLEAEAARLMADADARGPDDAGTEIVYLRATSIVHEILMRDPPKQLRSQALSWLGRSYRGLKGLDIWSLHLVYDAACVEEAPHTALAAECFARWLDGAKSELTGNGGAELPPDVQAIERSLRALAAP